MRKITEEAVEAFYSGQPYTKDNTMVTNDLRGVKRFYLHGNVIATIHKNILTISSCGWLANTTKERLNGILNKYNYYIRQSRGKWYLCSYNNNNTTEEFYDGMIIKID